MEGEWAGGEPNSWNKARKVGETDRFLRPPCAAPYSSVIVVAVLTAQPKLGK
jgi:hypothetical protein